MWVALKGLFLMCTPTPSYALAGLLEVNISCALKGAQICIGTFLFTSLPPSKESVVKKRKARDNVPPLPIVVYLVVGVVDDSLRAARMRSVKESKLCRSEMPTP